MPKGSLFGQGCVTDVLERESASYWVEESRLKSNMCDRDRGGLVQSVVNTSQALHTQAAGSVDSPS